MAHVCYIYKVLWWLKLSDMCKLLCGLHVMVSFGYCKFALFMSYLLVIVVLQVLLFGLLFCSAGKFT